MTNDTFLIPVAVTTLLILIFALLCYAKPRRNQTEFIIGLLNKLSEKDYPEEKEICNNEKRKY